MISLKQFKYLGILFFLIINISCAQNDRYNVKDFGAKGDGKTNDTDAIKRAVAKAEIEGGIVFFPAGNYMTNIIDIKPSSDHKIIFKGAKNATIQKRSDDATNIALFFCEVPDANLKFENLILEGNFLKRDRNWKSVNSHTIDVDDPTSGIYVYNVHTLEVNNCSIKNFHGDGIAMYHGNTFKAFANHIENVSINGIHTHKVVSSEIKENVIKNAGLVFSEIIIEGKKQVYDPKKYHTNFGDGILDISNKSIITKNKIYNTGRIGIVHDLAKDVGFSNSNVEVTDNLIELDSKLINSNNPPAGMWFEQSANVVVKNNKITIINSFTPIATGIRFYDITNSIQVNNNKIIAKSPVITNEAIGIFEPNQLKDINIYENEVIGNFKSGISFSYEKPEALINNLIIAKNSFSPSKNSLAFLTMTIYGQNSFPNEITLANNNINKDIKLFNLSYFGKIKEKKFSSHLKVKNNKVNNKLSEEKPVLDYLKLSYE